MLKLAPLSAVLLAQFVNADAGALESQHDARLCAVYGAFLNTYQHGGVQLKNAIATVGQYTKAEQCGALVGTPDKAGAAAKRAFKVYQAYAYGIAQALDAVAPCKLLKIDGKKATVAECEEYAERAAIIVADLVTSAITPKAKTEAELTVAAEKAAAKKAEKEKADKLAEKEAKRALQAEIDAAAQRKADKLAADNAPTVADYVRSVQLAAQSGMLDMDAIAALEEAIATARANVVISAASAPAEEALPA